MTPEHISAVVKTMSRSGRPLAGQMLTAMRGGVRMESPTTVAPDLLPTVTFMIWQIPELNRLSFLPTARGSSRVVRLPRVRWV